MVCSIHNEQERINCRWSGQRNYPVKSMSQPIVPIAPLAFLFRGLYISFNPTDDATGQHSEKKRRYYETKGFGDHFNGK